MELRRDGAGPADPAASARPRAARRDWLAKARVDHQLVGGWTDVYGYELPAEEGADWARFYNEHMAKDAAALAGAEPLATVPLQDGGLAAQGARRGARRRVPRRDDRDPAEGGRRQSRRPRRSTRSGRSASARQAAIFLHPHYICSDDRLDGYDLINAVGRLADTTIAVARLLFSGHLTRFPGVNLVVVACRRRPALCARPAEAQPGDPPGIRRPRRRVPPALFRHRAVRAAWRCGFSATSSAPTR